MNVSPPSLNKTAKYVRRWLLPVLLIAAAFRFSSVAFGLPSLNDQDELMFEMGAIKMLRGVTLNPGWFGHPGTTTMYCLALVNVLVLLCARLSGWFPDIKSFIDAAFTDPTWLILPGRVMIVGFGLWSIALTYRLGQRTAGAIPGLTAAALLAIMPLHISFSQIIRSDMMACTFMLLALLSAQSAGRSEAGLSQFVKAGLFTGLAVATKWPFGLAILAVCGAALLRWCNGDGAARLALKRTFVAGCASICGLVLASPFLIIDWPTVIENLRGEAQAYHLGATGGSFAWNARWYLSGPLDSNLGPVGILLAAIGIGLLARQREFRFVILPVLLGFLLMLFSQRLVWARWILPLLPILAIAVGMALAALFNVLQRLMARNWAIVVTVATAGMVVAPLTYASLADGRERMNDTRQMASKWLMNNVPPGKVVLIEHFGFDLIKAPYQFRWPVGAAGCIDPLTLVRGKASYQVIEALRENRSNVDYGTVAVDKMDNCKANYAIITQYDRYAAERARFPNEFVNYRRLFDRAQILAEFRPERGVSGGWVVRVLKLEPAAQPGPQ